MAIETDAGKPAQKGSPKKTSRAKTPRTTTKKSKTGTTETAIELSQEHAPPTLGEAKAPPAVVVKKSPRATAAKKRPTRKKPEAVAAAAPPAAEDVPPPAPQHDLPASPAEAPVLAAQSAPAAEPAAPTPADAHGIDARQPAEPPRRERGRRGGRRARGRRGRQRPEDRAPATEPVKDPAEPIKDSRDTETKVAMGHGAGPNGMPATRAERPTPRLDNERGRSDRRGRRGRRGRGRNGREGGMGLAELDGPSAEFLDEDELPQEVTPDEYSGDDEAPNGAAVRDMIINVSAGDECRIAVMHEGRLEELFIERTATQSHVGNIYKGRVTNVEPSIQAAFIDFGLPKNGFLHISDVQPQYFPNHHGESEDVGRKIPRHHRPLIQKCFRRGQEVIVQITKEGVGTKGPTLTTYLSIPGRFLVMMPGMSQVGVSRKIEDDTTRRKMRDMLAELELPPGMGFILRTAGLDRTKRELQRDLHYLLRLWKTVVDRVKNQPTPTELYRESDLVIRTIRDIYSPEFRRLVVDDAATAERAREFLQVAMPRSKSVVELYKDREPLFHRFGIEQEIERINMRHVPLRSGGSLVIDTTEAMVTIDVNSGKFRTLDDAEESAYRINLEAAEEIARQLRLRDLGGLLVCDFIDMRQDRHKRGVEKALRDALKKHKERARILRMSAFGIIEMTRQRQGPSLKKNIYYDCPHCRGAGVVKMPESVILDVMRLVQLAAHHEQVRKITVSVSTDVAFRILNKKRSMLSQIESETDKSIVIRGDAAFTSDQVECVCEDAREQPVNLPSLPQPAARG